MKKVKLAGAFALALMCGTFTMNSFDVLAIDNTTVITASQLDSAIQNAENALSATAGIESVAGQATYLRGLVNQAKVLSYDIEGNQSAGLDELVAALNEGARGLILTSGVNAQPVAQVSEPVATASTAARTATTEVATTQANLAVSVIVTNDEQAAENTAETTETPAETTETSVETTAETSAETADEEVELPKTGEQEKLSPVAVGITVGVIVFVALTGALAIVKRLKRDA